MRPDEIYPFILFKTKHKNHYYFNVLTNTLIPLHPLLFLILDLNQQGVDVLQWYNSAKHKEIELDGTKFNQKDLAYYIDRFTILQKGDLLNKVSVSDLFCVNLSEDDIRTQFSNVSTVAFEVTESCNLKCDYCIYGELYNHYSERQNNKLSIDDGRAFMNFLINAWNSNYNFSKGNVVRISFYGGEPLMNMEFIEEMVDYVGSKKKTVRNLRFAFGITTNGTLLEKYMDFLVRHDFYLTISLDGDKNSNKHRRFNNGKPSYQNVNNNILNLKEKHPSYFKKRVSFNSVLTSASTYPDIKSFFKTQFNCDTHITELNPLAKKKSIKDIYRSILDDNNVRDAFCLEEFNELSETKYIRDFNFNLNGQKFSTYNHLFTDLRNARRIPTGTCLPFSKRVFITAHGLILPCETIPHHHPLGKISNGNVDISFPEIAKKYNSLLRNILPQCSTCYQFSNCNVCYLLNINGKKACPNYRSRKNFTSYFKDQIEYFEDRPLLFKDLSKSY